MSAPVKPWERLGGENILNRNIPVQSTTSFTGSISPQDQLINTTMDGGGTLGAPATQPPPPLPPRPPAITNRYGYNSMSPYSSMHSSPYASSYGGMGIGGYGSGYSSYGAGGFGGYSGYGGYGNFGRYGGGYSNEYGSDNGFIQSIEENSRNAFQSVESVVQTFGSISMMLESTFCAVHNSFRAVIGVADQFARAKAHMGHLFSFFALIRGLKWLYRRILHLFGISPLDIETESAWTGAEHYSAQNDQRPKFRWPALMFLAVIFGAPWLILKLLSMSVTPKPDAKEWIEGKIDHHVAVALFNFNATSEQEISFRVGQEIRIAPKELQPSIRGWLLGSSDGKTSGFVPSNYVRLMGKREGTTVNDKSAADMEKLFEPTPSNV